MNEKKTLKNDLVLLQKTARERTVKTQTVEYDLETLVKKISKNIIKLNPEYQRNHRWNNETSSRLVESLILNIPIPYVYISQDIDVDEDVDEDDISRYSVIDGQQRLTAIYSFIKNEYSLEGLDILSNLNGMFYKDLPPFLLRRLEERTIKCLRIDSTLDQQVKYDIFERLNSGSVKLEAQELRNAVCRGPFKDLLKELVKDKNFVESCNLTARTAKIQKMEDEELVLRFFAINYKEGYKEYKGGFKIFLTDKMSYFNGLDKKELEAMKNKFIETFKKINKLKKPFSKYKIVDKKLHLMSTLNVAVFDAITHLFYVAPEQTIISSGQINKLFFDNDFFLACEGSTNDVKKVFTRIRKAESILTQ
jgi:hypothetical protein